MTNEATLDDFGLEVAIDALKRVSPQEQEIVNAPNGLHVGRQHLSDRMS